MSCVINVVNVSSLPGESLMSLMFRVYQVSCVINVDYLSLSVCWSFMLTVLSLSVGCVINVD